MTRRFAEHGRDGTRLASKPGTALGLPGTVTPRGLQLPSRLTFEDWQSAGQILQVIAGASLWWIGDWYLFGEERFGELSAQAIGGDTGYSPRTVQQAAWVCGRFPFSKRLENVPFSTHMVLAGVKDEVKRDELLALAAKERWTMRQAQEVARAFKELPAPEAPTISNGNGRSADVGPFVLTLYAEAGLLIVQRRDRSGEGIALDRSEFSDEAKVLVLVFLGERDGLS